ncbi:MAG: FkbM family methyltransferase [Opitutaceae bacterium]
MNSPLRGLAAATLGLIPVRVRGGAAKGARWTLYPWTSYWRGTHEPEVQAAVERLGNGSIRGWSCWDLGAHFGLYSVALAIRAGPGGQVAAFEPNPRSFARLERHRRMNRLECLRTYQAAASDRTGVQELLTYGDLGSTSTHLPYPGEARGDASAPIAIRTLRLDDLVDSGELRPPQFAKVDVEGHGRRAVEGMRKAIAASRPILMVGFHSGEEEEGVLGLLRPLGYRWAPIVAPSDPRSMVGGDYLFTP